MLIRPYYPSRKKSTEIKRYPTLSQFPSPMHLPPIHRISLVGAGNLSTHLSTHLHRAGLSIVDIFVRQSSPQAQKLAEQVGARLVVGIIGQLSADTDLILLALSDSAITEVGAGLAKEAHLSDKIIAHTSGATPLQTLAATGIERAGLFYPLQSFTLGAAVDMQQVPFLVSAQRAEDADALRTLALQLSNNVQRIEEEQRASLHLAAVFVNNFSNHLCYWAEQICVQKGVDWSILRPLMQNTIDKLATLSPTEAQTGPARRHDTQTIKRHKEILSGLPHTAAEIYDTFTQSIETLYTRRDTD